MEKNVKHLDGNTLENAFPNAEEAIQNAKTKGISYWKKAQVKWGVTKSFIEKHPAQAVGYAVLLGATLGILLYFQKRGSK